MNYKWHPDGPGNATSLYPGIKLALSWLLRSSEEYGVPEGRLNTNDEHGKALEKKLALRACIPSDSI